MDTVIFSDTNEYGRVHPPINITKTMQPYSLIKPSVSPIFVYLLLTIMGNSMNVLDNNSDSDGESKDDSLFTDDPNQLLLLPPITIPTVISVLFEEYYTNDENILTIDRTRYILAACIVTVDEFSLEERPYKDLKKTMLPTQVKLQQEILRRRPGHKIRKMKNKDLLEVLQSDELKIVNEVDKQYIADREK